MSLVIAALAFAITGSGLVAQAPASKTMRIDNPRQLQSAATPGSAESTVNSGMTLKTVPLQPPPAGFDVKATSTQVLNHLSSVVRYYRLFLVPVQKVGEPSDALYRDAAITNARQTGDYAFEAGKAEAALLVAYQKQQARAQGQQLGEGEAQKLEASRAGIAKRLQDLKTQEKSLNDQLERARPKQVQTLRDQKEQTEGAIELNQAMSDALGKIVGMSDTLGRAGLAGDIERLQRTAPELADSKAKTVPQPLESLSEGRSAGVSSQATVLFQLLGTRQTLDEWIRETDALHQQSLDLRTPLSGIVRGLVRKGQELSMQQAQNLPQTAGENTKELEQTKESFDSVTASFNVLSAAAVPLSQEIITLEQSRANLVAWRSSVDTEYKSVLRALLLRLSVIGVTLGFLFLLGEVWRRATTRYVHDLRHRRQLLIMRRLVVGILSALVLIFGFVTQFNSLATFAGFITAGLAVGLQTILLSVAAYFFIIGRYGVKVGDRITVAAVTGDVIEVGLVRFYMMELAGSGTELQATGRVAVFSNAVLFQAGTPLYKQVPGTEYAWHEMTVKLRQEANHEVAVAAISAGVQKVYEGYRATIEKQHCDVEAWMDASIDKPTVKSRLQLMDEGLQLVVRYPVEIPSAAAADEQVTEMMLKLIREDNGVKEAVTAPPSIKAAVKG